MSIVRTRLAWLIAVLTLLIPSVLLADDNAAPERVKAAYLFNFALYIDWPEKQTQGDFVIGVLGDKAVANALTETIAGRSIRNQTVRIETVAGLPDLHGIHILFLGSDAKVSMAKVLSTIQDKPVLLVTDRANALSQGAAVNFTLVDRRLRFEISLPSLQRAGLRVSSRLLGAAMRVERIAFLYDPHRLLASPLASFSLQNNVSALDIWSLSRPITAARANNED